MPAYFVDTWFLVAICNRLDIDHVLTNDHHFQQEGFTLLNQ